MKRIHWILLGLFLLSLVTVSSVYAIGIGSVDGVWEYVEDIQETSTTPRSGEGADCSRWASGNGDGASQTSNWGTAIQSTTSTTDENQVRYGLNGTSCRTFNSQSGFGFDGNDAIGISLQQTMPIMLGRFTHYNNPVNLSNPPNFMEWVDLDLTVTNILCGNGAPPEEQSTLSFVIQFSLEETPNNVSRCPYGGDANGCWDRVTAELPTFTASYTCEAVNEPADSQGTYTIGLIGLQPHTTADCSTQVFNPAAISNQLITLEQVDNHACLWAQVTRLTPTAVKVSSFHGVQQDQGILLSWETASEIDNLGFNLYRAEQLNGERIQVNPGLIPGMAPGSLGSNYYEFVDTTMALNIGNYYWLEDVDIHGVIERPIMYQ